MNKLILTNCVIITQDGDAIIENGSIFIKGHIIERVTANNYRDFPYDGYKVYDLKGKIVTPGLVNTHVHLSQQLARGIADDVDLLTWLEKRIWPFEASLTEAEMYVSALACIADMVKCGTTSFLEAGGQHLDAMAKAIRDSGIRGTIAKSTMDIGNIPDSLKQSAVEEIGTQEAAFHKYHDTCNGRLRVWFGLRTVFSNSENLIQMTHEKAKKYNTGIHMHVAEIKAENDYMLEKNGLKTVKYLEKLGVLDKNFLAVHAVWLDDEDRDIFAKRRVKVSHNPGAAMKVSLGFAPIPQMLEQGITIGLGSDGAPSNNQMNILREMYLSSLIFKGHSLNPLVMPANAIMAMATTGGAKASLLDTKIGKIKAGFHADLTIFDGEELNSLPIYDYLSSIVYSFDRSNVYGTMVDGNWLYYNRQITFTDEEQLKKEIKKISRFKSNILTSL